MEQNTWANQCQETCRQVWLFSKRFNIQQEAKANFLSTGIVLVYLLVFDIILAALFWMHCNFRRINLARFLKSELQ